METRPQKKNSVYGDRFKSYYVVWKHLCICRGAVDIGCLNRTMQYGNKFKQKTNKQRNNV